MRSKRCWKRACCGGVAAVLLAGSLGAQEANPYLAIVDRNTFGLRPPAPPAPPPAAPEAAPPPANTVRLTGITSILSKSKALFEITEPGSADVHKPIMAVGDAAQYGVELLSIDLAKNEVRIRNGNVETNVTFEAASISSPASPAAAMLPGRGGKTRSGRSITYPRAITQAQAANPAGASTVAGATRRTSSNSRNNITVAGGEPSAMQAYVSGGNVPGIPSAINPRTIPPRPLRTPTQPNAVPMTREEAIIRLELSREINRMQDVPMPPLPPTPITPAPTGYETQPQDE